MSQWQFCVLGTKAGGAPLVKRHSSSTALLLPSTTLLFDCAEHTQVQLLRAGISRANIDHIFLSHLHGDHILGLPGLISTFAGENRSRPLHIYAPNNGDHNLEEWLRYGLRMMDITGSHGAEEFPIHIHELHETTNGVIYQTANQTSGFTVSARMLEHRITSFGFRVDEISQPNIDLVRAAALGLEPGKRLGDIKRLGRVQLDDGRVIRLEDISSPPRKPRSFVYCGDTRVCAATVELARNASVMVHEATFADEILDKASERYHCTGSQAASQALLANVERLYLTHFSVRYKTLRPMLHQARRVFPHTVIAKELRIETI